MIANDEAAAKLAKLTEELERRGAWMPAEYVTGEPRGLTLRHCDLMQEQSPPEVIRFVTEAPELIRAVLAERAALTEELTELAVAGLV